MGEDAAAGKLLAAALAGDQDAWARIVDDHTRLLWWIARGYRLDESTAADVVQTVWLQLVRFGDRITNPGGLSAWLATTARREALRRVAQTDVPTDDLGDRADSSAATSDERLIDDDTLSIVLTAFERLPVADQRLLQLVCAVPPKSYDEIAVLLGRTVGYIGPSRQRALARLRAILDEMGLS